jgi:hypothetical protein
MRRERMMATVNNDSHAERHARVVARILEEVFELDTSGSEAEGGFGSEREGVEYDWLKLTPEELVSELDKAENIIDGFASTAEDISPVLLTFLSDAQKRAGRALQIAEEPPLRCIK